MQVIFLIVFVIICTSVIFLCTCYIVCKVNRYVGNIMYEPTAMDNLMKSIVSSTAIKNNPTSLDLLDHCAMGAGKRRLMRLLDL